MEFVRTVCVPLHYETDRVKLEKLDKLTARLSYCVSIFLSIIRLSGVATKEGLSQFEKDVQGATKLSSGFVQQCRDKAVWMWQSYLKLHRIWERKISNCGNEKYLAKLKKREPSMPTISGKVPVRLDCRTANLITNTKFGGKLVRSLKKNLAFSDFWLGLSTLKKRDKLMLPLKFSKYHLNRLKSCVRVVDCEVVKRGKKYYANFSCEYVVDDVDVHFFRAVDLGILRSLSTVLFDSEGNMAKNSFKIFRDNRLQTKLNKIDKRIKWLQRKRK